MKKLLIIAAIAMAGAYANAASVDWNVNSGSGLSYYVFNGDYSSAVVEALGDTTDGGSAAFAEYIDGLAATVYKSGTTGSKGASGSFEGAASTLTYLVFDAGVVDGNTYKIGTIATSGMTYDPAAQQSSPGKVKFDYKNGAGSAGTIASKGGDVPEPTSGLLLLLGMAGLALRRKQA